MSDRPLVSIGLPVYNGENFIEAAIGSILNQTFTDFELIISDNASTDHTAAICQGYAERDRRVRYYRNERNLGSAPNFNRTFELASGTYFKWMAHDDVLAPDFLAAEVEALEADPDAVLCYSALDIIDERGDVLAVDDDRLPGVEDGGSPSRRFAWAILPQHRCFQVFGLIRAEALRGTSLMPSRTTGDRALIVELALRGPFVYVAKPLFRNRDHPQRYIRAVEPSPEAVAAWWDTQRAGKFIPHYWTLYKDYWGMVARGVPSLRERLRCYGYLLYWLSVNRHFVRLIVDLMSMIDPRIFTAARAVKWRLFGPSQPLRGPISEPRMRRLLYRRVKGKPSAPSEPTPGEESPGGRYV